MEDTDTTIAIKEFFKEVKQRKNFENFNCRQCDVTKLTTGGKFKKLLISQM